MSDINKELLDQVMKEATKFAAKRMHEYVTLEHVLLCVMQDAGVQSFFTGKNVNIPNIITEMTDYLALQGVNGGLKPPTVTRTVTGFQQHAIALAMQHPFNQKDDGGIAVHALHIVVALFEHQTSTAGVSLRNNGITEDLLKSLFQETVANRGAPAGGVAMTAERANEILGKYTTNLNEEAKKSRIDPLIGRRNEVRETAKVLARRTKNNIILVGEPGVGKTAIIEGLARLIEEQKDIPEVLHGARIYSINVGSLVAGTRFRGDFEERIKEILDALDFLGEENIKTILFIDEMHMVMGAGAGGDSKATDLANMLKPYLSKGKLRCIGSTTNDEYRKHIEKDKALIRRFSRLDIFEPSVADTIEILKGLRAPYEEFHGLTYTDEAIEAAVRLSVTHMPNRQLPDKAIDILDSVGAQQRVSENPVTLIEVAQIEEEVAIITKRPVKTVKSDDRERLRNLDNDLLSVVFGQEEAISSLVDAVYIARAGLRDENKPEASFLFTGPTGTGKTEAAKQLALTLGMHLERFDMSEYMESHAVSKLIGSPPGYVGYDENGGRLINVVDQHPHSIILLDEIEKAHPEVINVLLQVLDDGKLTNSNGKVAHFKNVIFILTSNAGASDAQRGSIGFGRAEYDDSKTDEAIKAFFKPELINRLDKIVKFRALSAEVVAMVVNKFINELNAKAADQKVFINFDADARALLAKNGYDPKLGARPLARVIHNQIKSRISREILFGALTGGGTALVGAKDDAFTFSFGKSAAEPVSPTEPAEA